MNIAEDLLPRVWQQIPLKKSLDYLSRKDIECTGAQYLTEPTRWDKQAQQRHSQGLSRNGLPRLPLLFFSHQILIMETLASTLL